MPPAPRRHRPWQARIALLLAASVMLIHAPMPDASNPDLRPGHHVVDALEHRDLARLEGPTGETVVVPRSWLPEGAREGDVLTPLAAHEDTTGVRFDIDAAATEARRDALQERRDGLPKAPSGDLEL